MSSRYSTTGSEHHPFVTDWDQVLRLNRAQRHCKDMEQKGHAKIVYIEEHFKRNPLPELNVALEKARVEPDEWVELAETHGDSRMKLLNQYSEMKDLEEKWIQYRESQ